MALLNVRNMSHNFGGLQAVSNYNLSLEPGQITGLIGPNGAGKTTIFNLITGMYAPTRARSCSRAKPRGPEAQPDRRPWAGPHLPGHAPVAPHERAGARQDGPLLQARLRAHGSLSGHPQAQPPRGEATELAMEYLAMFGVDHFADQLVVNLPYGAQRRVEMARALVDRTQGAFSGRAHRRHEPGRADGHDRRRAPGPERFNLAIFLIEHRLRVVTELCEHVQALVFGEVIVEGDPDRSRTDPKVIEAYLGDEEVEF